jgi:hypothetical protein
MAFIKSILKRKCTKRKCTKRKCTKRKCTKRKSNKYGGTFISNPNNAEIRKRLLTYLEKQSTEIGPQGARDIVEALEYSEYEYDFNYVLQQFKAAIKKSNENWRNYPRVNAIYDALIEMEQEAKEKQAKEQQAKEQQAKETPKEETQIEDSNNGCPSRDNEPINCIVKKDYLKQALLFHPDKNPTCIDEATRKFQELQNNPTCNFID